MATMASLIVEVGGNIANFVGAMTKMEAVAAANARKISKEFQNLGREIGVALSAGAFAYAVKGAIDAMDRLDELSKTTKVAVEDLVGLQVAAKKSGTTLDDAAKAINKLQENTGKFSEKFAALGITAKNPLEAFKQFADVFNSIDDPALRAAVASEALGKSWQTTATLMSLGSQGIQELIDKGKSYSSVTADMVAQADAFNDILEDVTTIGKGVFMAWVGQLLPLLSQFASDMESLAASSRKTAVEFSPLLEAGKAVAVVMHTVWFAIRGLAIEIGGMAAQFVAFFTGTDPYFQISDQMKKDAEDRRRESDEWERRVMAIGTATQATAFATDDLAATYEDAAKKGTKAGNALAKGFLDAEKNLAAAKKAAEDLAKLLDKLEGSTTGLNPDFKNNVELLNNALAKGAISAERHERAMAALVKLQPSYKAGLQAEITAAAERNREWDDEFDKIEAVRLAKENAIKAVREDAEALEFESAALTMSNAARARAIALLSLHKAGVDITAEAVQNLADRIYNQIEAMEQTRKQIDIWDEMANAAVRFFDDLVFRGRKAFDILKDLVKQFLAELLAVFVKRWVLQIGAAITGSTAMGAMAGQVGSNTIAGSLASAIGGSSFISGIGGSFGTSFGAGWNIGTGVVDAAAGSAANYGIAGTMGDMAGQAWAWAAANPALAVAAVVIIAALAISRMRSGGPKEGGSFFGGFDSAGNFTGNAMLPGSDNGRFFTPSGNDAAMSAMGQQFAGTFFTTLARLGGTTGSMQFGLGSDQDPRGTAANRVAGAVYRDGMQVFRSMMEAGRDDEDLQRAFSLTMKRMLLGGLQASDLPAGVARILSSVSAAAGTEAEIDAVIGLATAFGDLMTLVTAPFSSGGIIDDASRTVTESLRMQGEALLDLADNTDMTVGDLQALGNATASFRNAAAQLIITLKNLKDTALETIDGLIEQTALAGMDPQQQFNYWQGQANSLFEQMMASTDPAEIERLLGQFTTAWNNAWNLLTPEQQAANGADWGNRLRAARTAIDEHITALIEGVATSTQDVLDVVGDKMDAAADKFAAAAETNSTAANTFAGAVDRGVKVSIILDQYGNAIVNEGAPA